MILHRRRRRTCGSGSSHRAVALCVAFPVPFAMALFVLNCLYLFSGFNQHHAALSRINISEYPGSTTALGNEASIRSLSTDLWAGLQRDVLELEDSVRHEKDADQTADDVHYQQNRSFTKSLPCIYKWANRTERLFRHEWMFPCPSASEQGNNSTNWTYIHVMKAGGTTAFSQCGFTKLEKEVQRLGPIRAEWMYRTSNIFTFVRDPVDHFFSGFKQCASESQPTTFPFPKREPARDEHILEWLHTLGHRNHTNRLRSPLTVFYCFLHSAPQIEFLLFHDDDGVLEHRPSVPSTDILPHIKYIGDMSQIEEFFHRQHLPWRTRGIQLRKHPVKDRMGAIRENVSNETLMEVCRFVAVDYCFFDYEPPAACASLVADICSGVCPP